MIPRLRSGLPAALALASLLALGACDTAEERAEGHYQRALALLDEGDVERARLELRNVFRLNGAHVPARLEFARLLREQGDIRGAMGHYLRVVEQDRDNAAVHRDIAELALQLHDYDTAADNADRAYALAPEDPLGRALKATVDFRRGERETALAMAEAVIAERPDIVPAHIVAVAERMAADDFAGALARADAGIAAVPDDQNLHLARLTLLERMQDEAGTGAQLVRMAELFPENTAITRSLIAWHVRAGDPEAAEAVLRELAASDPDAPEGWLAVVGFLHEARGPAAARAELDRLIAASAEPAPFRRARAGLDFAEGKTAEAVAALEALIAEDPGSDVTRDTQVTLARMLREIGRAGEAEALVAAVLEADPAHVEALKLRARAHVDADRPEEAIADMRTALGQAPRDPEIMTIMAAAHEREGSRELATERLALAVEASNYAPAESLRYARLLMADGRAGPAEGVIVDALRRAPENRELLTALAGIHLDRGDHVRVRRVGEILRRSGDPASVQAAASLEMAALRSEGRTAETIAMLESLAEAAGDDGAPDTRPDARLGARIGLVRSHAAAGDLDAARAQVEAILAEDPDSLAGRMMRAGLDRIGGDEAAAEAGYRAVIAADPTQAAPHQALVALLFGTDRGEEAREALDEGLAATGRAPQLMFLLAGILEAEERFEEAIALFEELYARDSANPVIANNLASLLATHRIDDPESLERAFAIARRLRGTDVPQFQDTYGWILARRGDAAGALAYLEPAARALADDPLVQYHLGVAYLALDRADEARAQFARAVEVAGADSALPQIAAAREHIAAIDSGGSVEAASGG